MPKEPTLLAVRRALWYSFGSIAYGSLAPPTVQFLHQASPISKENSFYEGVSRVIYVIEWSSNWLLKFFNVKASPSLRNLVPEPMSLTRTALRLFTHGFRQPGDTTSVKKTSRPTTEREIDTLVNNNLVWLFYPFVQVNGELNNSMI